MELLLGFVPTLTGGGRELNVRALFSVRPLAVSRATLGICLLCAGTRHTRRVGRGSCSTSIRWLCGAEFANSWRSSGLADR